MFFFVVEGSQSFDFHGIPTPVFVTDQSHFSHVTSVNQLVKKFSAFYVKQMYVVYYRVHNISPLYPVP